MRARPIVVLSILCAGLPLAVRADSGDGAAEAAAAVPGGRHPAPDAFSFPRTSSYEEMFPDAWPPDRGSGSQAPGEASSALLDEDIRSTLVVYGALSSESESQPKGYVAGAWFVIEGSWLGIDASIDAVGIENVTGPVQSSNAGDPIAWGAAHVTWSVISTPWLHVRVLTGGSMLALPKSKYTSTQPWTGTTLFGPEGGVNGSLRLIGPLGAEGWARLTPFPVRVEDFYAGLTISSGRIGVGVGWRKLKVAGDGVEAPAFSFAGPQACVGLRF